MKITPRRSAKLHNLHEVTPNNPEGFNFARHPPEVGDMLLYVSGEREVKPCPAIVTAANGDKPWLTVFSAQGDPFNAGSVPMLHPGDPKPVARFLGDRHFCIWPVQDLQDGVNIRFLQDNGKRAAHATKLHEWLEAL